MKLLARLSRKSHARLASRRHHDKDNIALTALEGVDGGHRFHAGDVDKLGILPPQVLKFVLVGSVWSDELDPAWIDLIFTDELDEELEGDSSAIHVSLPAGRNATVQSFGKEFSHPGPPCDGWLKRDQPMVDSKTLLRILDERELFIIVFPEREVSKYWDEGPLPLLFKNEQVYGSTHEWAVSSTMVGTMYAGNVVAKISAAARAT